MLIFSDKENVFISKQLTGLQNFSKNYPSLFNMFVKKGFVVELLSNETDFYLFKYIETNWQGSMYKITINPTLDCNFNCWYCSVSTAGAKVKNSKMIDVTIDKIKLHIERVIARKKHKSIVLDWFGGEPMLYYKSVIRPLAIFLKEKCVEKQIDFSHFITTNASLITNDIIKEFKIFNVSYFQITLDGSENRHNKIRNDGTNNSYRTIINNIIEISNEIDKSEIIVRINYDKKTLHTIHELINDIDGVKKENVIFDFQRVWQVEETKGENEKLKEVMFLFEKKGYRVRYPSYMQGKYHRCMFDKKDHIVINYDGSLYKCSARDYSEKFKVGQISDLGELIFNSNYYKYFNKILLDECIDCKHLPLCAGPCIQHKFEYIRKDLNFDDICIIKHSELSINSFILDKAKKILNENNNN